MPNNLNNESCAVMLVFIEDLVYKPYEKPFLTVRVYTHTNLFACSFICLITKCHD